MNARRLGLVAALALALTVSGSRAFADEDQPMPGPNPGVEPYMEAVMIGFEVAAVAL